MGKTFEISCADAGWCCHWSFGLIVLFKSTLILTGINTIYFFRFDPKKIKSDLHSLPNLDNIYLTSYPINMGNDKEILLGG
jgi:hypothetical protein